ncbi:hypothetical protein AMK13_17685 [Streptomyces sp. CB02056]|nr:hypothetical protein AMK13_17685 [Streptomyces sp. CB02056]
MEAESCSGWAQAEVRRDGVRSGAGIGAQTVADGFIGPAFGRQRGAVRGQCAAGQYEQANSAHPVPAVDGAEDGGDSAGRCDGAEADQ